MLIQLSLPMFPSEKLASFSAWLEKEGLNKPHVTNQNSALATPDAPQGGGALPQTEKPAQPSGKPGRPTKAETEARKAAEKAQAATQAAPAQSAAAPAPEKEVEGDDSGWGSEESDDDKPLTPDQRSKLMVALKAHSKANSFDETKALLKETTGTNDPAKVTRGYFDAVIKALA